MTKIGTLSDNHIHTSYSSDSVSSPQSMIQESIKLGLQSICITDHNDFGYVSQDGKCLFQLDFETYINELTQLKTDFENKITINIGVEQGLQKKYSKEINSYGSNELDFIIGSSHVVDGIDPYYQNYWKDISIHEGISQYYNNIIENITVCNNFDVYGHIDYIIRYIPDSNFVYKYSDFFNLIDEALQLLIYKGKGIEINTSGYKYGLNQPHPSIEILKRYKELGGEIITIGSDAHKPEHLAYSFDKVQDILKACGFDYYTVFRKRIPEFIKLI